MAQDPTQSVTFALRKETPPGAPANTTLTCTVNGGTTSGSTTGANVSFSAGDLVDVQIPSNWGGVKGAVPSIPSFAFTVSP